MVLLCRSPVIYSVIEIIIPKGKRDIDTDNLAQIKAFCSQRTLMIDCVWSNLFLVKSIRCGVFLMSILFSWTRGSHNITKEIVAKEMPPLHFKVKFTK